MFFALVYITLSADRDIVNVNPDNSQARLCEEILAHKTLSFKFIPLGGPDVMCKTRGSKLILSKSFIIEMDYGNIAM